MEEIAIFDMLRRHVYLIGALSIVTTVAGYVRWTPNVRQPEPCLKV
jgi:hypothetical protein